MPDTAPRDRTRRVLVGGVPIGGGSPVAVQSMTSTDTADFDATIAQVRALADAGCDIVRVTLPNRGAVPSFARVCEESPVPIVADIHFDYRLALAAIESGAAKLRINPGNIGSWERVDAVIDAAGAAGCAIRIGVNAGSLEDDLAARDDLTLPEKLVASSERFVSHFEDRGFTDIVLSAKAHSVPVTIETYRALSRALPQVPLHLGVTEAGTPFQGTIKSAVGLGSLLADGIGDTMRVSLTADPVEEPAVCWGILQCLGLRRRGPELVSCPTCGRTKVDLIPIACEAAPCAMMQSVGGMPPASHPEGRSKTVQSTKRVMKMSTLYAPTLKEDPAEAELASHRLLLRAGMIRKQAAGLYSYLPLAWRSLKKIEAVVRDEMDAAGAQECLLPILTDAGLWRESGRWDAYGPELMRLHDRHDREFALGPTHEETITDLVKNELRSYKQLPVNLYQIQTKFRDEMRPRFGLMRGREFIMKDAYSFSATQESLQEIYDAMKQAYANICERVGLHALPVVADSGQIGGDTSVEFMALADAGEASLVYCDACGFAADDEAATTRIPVSEGPGDGTLQKVHTPGLGTIEAVADFFGFPENGTRKSLALIDGEGRAVVAIVPGDHELNEVKAEHLFGDFHLMTDEELDAHGLHKGFIGPVGLPEGVRLVVDESLRDSLSWTCGANEVDYHFTGARPGRDFTVDEWGDIVTVHAGDPCPKCGRPLEGAHGIEVSQVFQLGTKYSEAMGATFMDEDGRERPLIRGCYGVGVSRTLAAIVEQHNDEHGIVWPVSVAPYEVSVISLDKKGEALEAAERIAGELAAAGLEVVLDDRAERPGVKFADNDLMGFPYQVIVGKRGLSAGTVELKDRATGERQDVPVTDIASHLVELVVPQRA